MIRDSFSDYLTSLSLGIIGLGMFGLLYLKTLERDNPKKLEKIQSSIDNWIIERTLNEYYKVTNDSSLKIESIKTLEDLRPIRIHINKARSEKIINKFYGKDPT